MTNTYACIIACVICAITGNDGWAVVFVLLAIFGDDTPVKKT